MLAQQKWDLLACPYIYKRKKAGLSQLFNKSLPDLELFEYFVDLYFDFFAAAAIFIFDYPFI